MTTKLKLTGTPDTLRYLDLADPIWHVQHLAKAKGVKVDRARRYTYMEGFPRPKDGFERNSYCREAVLAWFRGLPDAPPARSRGKHASRPHSRPHERTDPHPARVHTSHPAALEPQPDPRDENIHAGAPTPPATTFYKPRRKR
ncbi:hypothetical protein ACNKF0_09565 [Nocardioides sp. T5]|uniref:hypothetical protein n=1 Tax=Nocardioides sp. T5 TaxID=3400182 RepID=UPI003A86516F